MCEKMNQALIKTINNDIKDVGKGLIIAGMVGVLLEDKNKIKSISIIALGSYLVYWRWQNG